MSTLLDAGTVVLEALDFDPTCEARVKGRTCSASATHALVCTFCGTVTAVSCEEHAASVLRATWTATERVCGARAPLAVMVRVVPLNGGAS